jgi:FkbM family methyltransferase
MGTCSVGGVASVDVDGYSLEVPPDMRWAFRGARYFEVNVDHWFLRCLEQMPGRVVFDVGANYGYFTLRAAARGATVHAFEPTGATSAVLERTLAANGLTDTTAHRLALSDRVEVAELTRYSSSGNNAIIPRDPQAVAHLSVTGRERVPTATIDGLVRSSAVPAPALVKIDAEGSEMRILRGAEQTLRRDGPLLLLEHDEAIAADAGYGLPDVLRLLESCGYEARALRAEPDDLAAYAVDALDAREVGGLLCGPLSLGWPHG